MKTQTMVSFERLCNISGDVREMRDQSLSLVRELERIGLLSKRRARLAFDHLDQAYMVVLQSLSDASPAELV